MRSRRWSTPTTSRIVRSTPLARAIVLRAEHSYADALGFAREGRNARQIGDILQATEALVEAVEAALALNDLDTAGSLLEEAAALPPVEHTLYMDAQLARLGAWLAARRGASRTIDELAAMPPSRASASCSACRSGWP